MFLILICDALFSNQPKLSDQSRSASRQGRVWGPRGESAVTLVLWSFLSPCEQMVRKQYPLALLIVTPCSSLRGGAGNHWSKPVGAMMGEGQADMDAGRSDSQQHAAEPFVKVLSDSKGIGSISHCMWKGDWPPGGHFSISEQAWCVEMGKKTLTGWHMVSFQPSLSSAAVHRFNYEWESWDLTVFHIRALVWTPNGSSPPRFKLLLLWQSTCQEFIS